MKQVNMKQLDNFVFLDNSIEGLLSKIHTSGNKYLLAKINCTVSGVQERYNRYAYRSPSTTYGMLLSIDFFVCINKLPYILGNTT